MAAFSSPPSGRVLTFLGWGGARSRGHSDEMEGSRGGWLIGFFRSLFGMRGSGPVHLVGTPMPVGWPAIALSTTSMAVDYAVMLETGFNKTDFGKGILGACFINDLGTVIALGVLFAPFTFRTVIFLVATVSVVGIGVGTCCSTWLIV